jgi:hypothetical protein
MGLKLYTFDQASTIIMWKSGLTPET